MAGRIPPLKALFWTSVIVGAGYTIMATTTPTEQQFYDSLAPDLKRKVDEARRARLEGDQLRAQQARLQGDAESPVWADQKKPPPR